MPYKTLPIGQRFGKLVVISQRSDFKSLCRCDCGIIKEVWNCGMKSGNTRSCGCYRDELRRRHGHAKTRTYKSWASMLQRCINPEDNRFNDYGGRGIKVCLRWRNSFVNFLKDMGERPQQTTLGRLDNDGNYTPKNCEWQTKIQQARNTRATKWLVFQGIRASLAEHCERTGMNYARAQGRLKLGWNLELALTSKKHAHNRICN